MDRAQWLDRMHSSMVAFWRLMARSSEGGHMLESEGVVAGVIPATPDRSVMNAVLYADEDLLAAAIDDLADAYEAAGVRAWTVWVPEDDTDTAAMLAGRGHRLDAEPRAMVAELEGFDQPDLTDLDWTTDIDSPDVGRVNDRAFGIAGAGFEAAMADCPDDLRLYAARMDGRPAAVVGELDADGDAGIWSVATLPQARGRGLCTALMRKALADARDRGCTTTTLQATKPGRPVYERVGYRDLGVIQMWERRRS